MVWNMSRVLKFRARPLNAAAELSQLLPVLVMVGKCLKMTQLGALITCMFKFLSVGTQAGQRP